MNFRAHDSRATTEEGIRKTLFVIVESHRNNRYLMLDGQSESSIFKFAEHDRFFGNTAFGKNADAQSLIESLLGAVENFHPTFGRASVNQNACSFVKKSEEWNLNEF